MAETQRVVNIQAVNVLPKEGYITLADLENVLGTGKGTIKNVMRTGNIKVAKVGDRCTVVNIEDFMKGLFWGEVTPVEHTGVRGRRKKVENTE